MRARQGAQQASQPSQLQRCCWPWLAGSSFFSRALLRRASGPGDKTPSSAKKRGPGEGPASPGDALSPVRTALRLGLAAAALCVYVPYPCSLRLPQSPFMWGEVRRGPLYLTLDLLPTCLGAEDA
jgi:hypothetical protein